MTDIFNSHNMSSVTQTDITSQIEEMRKSMEQNGFGPFSGDSSEDDEPELGDFTFDSDDEVIKEDSQIAPTEERDNKKSYSKKCSHLKAKHTKHGLLQRQHSNSHKHAERHSDNEKEHSNLAKNQANHTKEHIHQNDHIHHTKHHVNHNEEHIKHIKRAHHTRELVRQTSTSSLTSRSNHSVKDRNQSSRSKRSVHEKGEESMNAIIHIYDTKVYQPIIAGQCKDDVNVPIMSPPPEVDEKTKFNFENTDTRTSSAMYGRSMSFKLLLAGDKTVCEFNDEDYETAFKSLCVLSEKAKSQCLCSPSGAIDDGFGSWDAPYKSVKSKSGKRRKQQKLSSEAAFSRLTGTLGVDKDDPVQFKHHERGAKYIERYRFFHTVGRVGRPQTGTKAVLNVKKSTDATDPYFSKMKSICNMASATDLYNLLSSSQTRDKPSSVSSSEDTNEISIDEESSTDNRPYSMRDRGKALNLAPVRETSVPAEFVSVDQMDQYQKNRIALDQYLNLTTPPVNCLQFEIEDASQNRRYGNRLTPSGGYGSRLTPTGDPNSTSRRGARTLRLGSAEFVKPGVSDHDVKWSCEKRVLPRAATFHASTVPGSLIVGSTVTTQTVPSQTARIKSGGNNSPRPYVQFQKEHLLKPQPPKTPPQQFISGKKFKPCERYNDISSARDRDRTKLVYTHVGNTEKIVAKCHTATVVDLKETPPPRRDRMRPIMLDVNHLGIRGRPFTTNEQITILYKNRRTASLKS